MKRRDFIHSLSHAAIYPSLLDSLSIDDLVNGSNNLLSNTITKDRILILIKLDGGNDGLNTLVPLDQLSALNKVRKQVVLPEQKIIKLEKNNLGLHPSLTFFKELDYQKRLRIIQSVGYNIPNYSHFHSMDIWMTGVDKALTEYSGWIGRYLENQHPNYPQNYPNPNYPDPLALEIGYNSSLLFNGKNSFTSVVCQNPDNFFEIINEFDNSYSDSLRGNKLSFLQLISNQSNLYNIKLKEKYNKGSNKFQFPSSSIGNQLSIINRLITGGLNTRIYTIQIGGFDTHSSQVSGDNSEGMHADLLKQLNDSLEALYKNLDYTNNSKRVLLMTFSEFGRTVISNGSYGTDHGTVAPMFFIGDMVESGILGKNPSIPSDADWTYEMEMQYDFRQVYYSVIKQWLGGNEDTAENVLFKKFDQLPIIQSKYVDTDGDGVSDDRDLCNSTPLGAMVNTDGCEIFSLPADNYTILTNGVSCSGKSNGKVSISVVNTEYTYALSIAETESTFSLDADNEHQLEIDELEIGTYTLNFTVEGKEGYLQTFEIGITEPPSLSAKSSVNQKGKTMTVNLTGSDLYYAEVNGERRSYQINTLTLQLRPGMNIVRIYTPQDCQGEYVEQVFISEQVRHYPNPVKSDLNLVIPGEDSNTNISIYSRSGSLVAQYEETIPFSRIVTINASQLPSDIYVIKVNGQTVDQTFKIIKR